MNIIKSIFKMSFISVILLSLYSVNVFSATLADVEESFYPYRNGVPTHPGLEVGMVISADNADDFAEIIDKEVFKMLKDGWLTIKVGETTSFDLHSNYVEATKEHLGKASLGAKTGQLEGYVSGRAFPEEPSKSDPRAGEKLAWNNRYGYNWGDSAAIYPMYWTLRDMTKDKIERTLKLEQHFIHYIHRVDQEPIPELPNNSSRLFKSIYTLVLKPYDVTNTQLLITSFEDDLKRSNAWMYLGFQRRVRRLATGQVTDAFLGTDIMIEDFEGYNGRISDMKWNYVTTRNMLLPFYNHNDLPKLGLPLDEETHKDDPTGYKVVSFGGKGHCFPNVTWQLRKAYEVDVVPVDTNHPISKRVMFMDAQTYSLPRMNLYDRAGKLWKVWILGQAHSDHHLQQNKGKGVSIDDSLGMIDVQACHCTTSQKKGVVDPTLSPRDKFTVQNLRKSGH